MLLVRQLGSLARLRADGPDCFAALDVPFHLFAAAQQSDEVYRKPATGMLDLYLSKYNAGIAIG